MAKWPPTMGWKGHFESPGIWFLGIIWMAYILFFHIFSQVVLVERIIWFIRGFVVLSSKKTYDWRMQLSPFFGCLSWWNLPRFLGISPDFPGTSVAKNSILPSRGPFIKARSSMAPTRRISNSKSLGIFFWVRNLVMKIPG